MAKRLIGLSIAGLVLLCLAAVLLYNVPPIHERLSPRLAGLRVQVRRMINPPEQVVFVPQEQLDSIVQSTLEALTPTLEPSPTSTPTELSVTNTPEPSLTPTPSPTPLPDQVLLTGIKHEYQSFNNCGPANLSMTLSSGIGSATSVTPLLSCAVASTTRTLCHPR